ncbi:MAG: RNA polymerase sigma factor [Anaerolineales bacterium]
MQKDSTDIYEQMIKLEEEKLVGSALASPEAFGELYQRYLPQVYRYHLAKSGDINIAQDLTTQTFISALEGLHSYRGQGSFQAWLMGIARRKAAFYFRSHRPAIKLEEADGIADPSPSVEHRAFARIDLATLSRALKQLPPDRAEAVYLCVISDLTSREAGAVMGKSPGAVKMLLLRGLRDLRELLRNNSTEEER